jgi:CxxC-x17-CxxC domain-containing protein
MVERPTTRVTAYAAVETGRTRRSMAAEGRKMYDVRVYNLKCEACGKAIEELPFQPLTSTRPVYCQECNASRKSEKRAPRRRRPKKRRR